MQEILGSSASTVTLSLVLYSLSASPRSHEGWRRAIPWGIAHR